ncbi:MAG: hypothetical protein ACLRI8_06090 [Agathobacter rectalis]
MSRRRAGLSFRRQRRKFNLPLFKEIVSWVVELIVVIGLAYVLVSFFGIRTNVVVRLWSRHWRTMIIFL